LARCCCAALRDTDDPTVIAGAVEEPLRYLTIVHFRVILAGHRHRRGGHPRQRRVILANDTANRDPSAFPDPYRLDLHRDARRHVAFGFGAHQCLGQPLPRVELQVVYATLCRRIPTMRLAVDLGRALQARRIGLRRLQAPRDLVRPSLGRSTEPTRKSSCESASTSTNPSSETSFARRVTGRRRDRVRQKGH
jgi:cytochrome P450